MKPHIVTKKGIEFNEDLYLYKVRIYDSGDNSKVERYVTSSDLLDALRMAEVYYNDEYTSIVGVWEVGIVLSRFYND